MVTIIRRDIIGESPFQNQDSPVLNCWFENKFARLEYTGKEIDEKDKFQLFFMRHTREWIKILEDKTLDKCLDGIKTLPWFVP